MRRLRYLKKDVVRNWDLYILAIPMVVYYVIFCYGPMYGLKIAFMDYNPWKGMSGSSWVGFKHFYNFLSLSTSLQYIGNTLRISLCSLIFSYPLPILLALMFNSVPAKRFRKTVQTVFYMPHFVSTVVVVGCWRCSPTIRWARSTRSSAPWAATPSTSTAPPRFCPCI